MAKERLIRPADKPRGRPRPDVPWAWSQLVFRGLAPDGQHSARVPAVLIAVGVRLICLATLQLRAGPLEVAVVGPQVLMRDYVRRTVLIDPDDFHIDLHGLVTVALDYECAVVSDVQIQTRPV